MSDVVRKIIALSILIIGAGLIWVARSLQNEAEAAKNHIDSTISEAREHAASQDPRLKTAYREERGGWIYVHLEGDPATIGFQHGYELGPEIEDAFAAVSAGMVHSTRRDWPFFRRVAREMLWPKIDPEYQQELQGIAEGLAARTGSQLDVYDIAALNSFEEVPDYYVPWLNKQGKTAEAPNLKSPGNCSAFVATGSWTKDGQIVIAHNNWTNYVNGERWRIIFDIRPTSGYRILMDGFPGVIASDDDFGINSDGLMVTETTITQVIDVTVTRESTTTTSTSTTTSTTTTTIATQPGSAQPPTASQASQSLAPAHASPPATAAAAPPALSHTGAPIVFELVLAALLLAVGGLILGRRRLFRRRRA